ncbi:Tn7 transposase TnsA N-terminal domain-containing protein [Variovorax sp. N23]|uniref:Tn7 transposase TnsA N-terminal domain-containing protein n=1 Tax=Variovorax sp. N23 TaxID=2980555 RepID=UPI0021C9862E|nr:Tn7 transposase TnsA N-terminal domain-containing protein [Variovorax sp. N23]MCU4120997.1 Tn7 transposase TnsA N-terminal domain-containing protein [Variovorax sp. N23]
MTRKVVTRSPHREVGVVNAGWLLDHAVEHESHLERRFVMAALSCPVIQDIVHQPFTLDLTKEPIDTADKVYTPDFKVTFRDGTSLFVEVKPEVFVQENADRLRLIARCMRRDGLRFFIANDVLIDGNGLSARAMLLMRYGRLRFSDAAALDCLNAMREACKGSSTIKALVEQGLNDALIWNLVARHKCRVPADFSIDEDQVITTEPLEGDCHDYFLSWFGASVR